MPEKLFLVMPAYNEQANIRSVVAQFHPVVEKIGNGSKLVVVDDGSKDDTYKILKELSLVYPCLLAVTKPNSGHGPTCLFAYRYAMDNGADWIFQTDSDGQTVPDEFWKFWELRNNYDFIIGNRMNRTDGFSRIVVTNVLKLVLFFKFGILVKDANTPFRLMRTDRLKFIMDIIPGDFFLSNVLISCLIILKKEKLHWVPITFKPRQGGINSINLKKIFKIGIKSWKDFGDAKKKVCL
ncbi:MAG: glycosyltransferase family 2 protein [Bacteroidales bacterium]|jgi:glycosyltransferase involved in cell wall biosynthesis|nr:glycosyltransferase family 2 protein [Bacteroidales bacterium]